MADQKITTEQEIWKEIPGYPGYEVSNQGRVRSYHKYIGWQKWIIADTPQRILKPFIHKSVRIPYWEVGLQANGRVHQVGVHKLMLCAFVGPCPTGMQACHNDGDNFHNVITNLRWDTCLNNNRDKIKHGTSLSGIKNHKAKLTEEQVKEIRDLYSQGFSTVFLGKFYGIAPNNIALIGKYKLWKHIP